MTVSYLGYLPREDPLFDYLQSHIAPQLGFFDPGATYRVFRFDKSGDVYLYEEKYQRIRLVGKFFKSSDRNRARQTGETEYRNLLYLRDIGFSNAPHYVVRPYGFNTEIDNLLVVEYIAADTLSSIINDALYSGKHHRLFRKLSSLAHFLVTLHNRTAGEVTVNFDESCHYMGRLLKTLTERWGIGVEVTAEFGSLRELWRDRSCMWEDRNVLVHGDATPANFLFGGGAQVMAIDLEKMKWADRVFDLGRLCGELKHFFFRGTGDAGFAEPFISHFLWEYGCHFPDRESAFYAITRRIPFYMGITLLRIARNSWVDTDYRRRLLNEARQILRATL
jgi:aminoglycoside phosphotransferase (APT) family kinase protein